jgi:hypothetical protein
LGSPTTGIGTDGRTKGPTTASCLGSCSSSGSSSNILWRGTFLVAPWLLLLLLLQVLLLLLLLLQMLLVVLVATPLVHRSCLCCLRACSGIGSK